MAEGKTGGAGLFAKQVQKRFSRAQEKVWRDTQPPSLPPKKKKKIPYFILVLSFSATVPLRGWHDGHRAAPVGAHRVVIGALLGQRHGCFKASGLVASPQSPSSCFGSPWVL